MAVAAVTKFLVRPKGLVLDQNAIAPVDGAMRVADHVVIDQPGVVRARPTNSLQASKASTTYRPRVMLEADGILHAYSFDVSGGVLWRYESTSAVIDSSTAVPPTQAQSPRLSAARGSVYYTTATGIRKHIPGDASAIYAGVEPPPIILGTADHGLVAVGSVPTADARFYLDTAANGGVRAGDVVEWWKTRGTAYQEFITIKREDANGYVRRGPPARLAFTGSTVPEPDAFLWASYVLTSADISQGYVLVYRLISSGPPVDDRKYIAFTSNDDDLGEALYTNPGQQGALGAKYPPPLAAEVAQWNGITWYGNTFSKHRAQVTITNVAGSQDVTTVDAANRTGLLGAITSAPILTGTTTSGSAVITAVSDDIEPLLRVGMFITDNTTGPATAGTAFPADTTILSWATGGAPGTVDITCSANATASGSRNVYLGDVVTVGGRNFYAWAQDEVWSPDAVFGGGRRVFGVASTAITATGRNAYTAQTLAAAINYEAIYDSTWRLRARVLGEPYVYSSTVTAPSTVLIEEIGVGGSSFTVSSSDSAAFSPSLPVTSDNDEGPGLLWYSEPDEPEAVPLPNFFRVGNLSEPILALTPLRDSLLVWKRDGLFRVTGTAPDGWRVDPIDNHVRLLASTCVDVMEGDVYAWTDHGIVRATETGVELVSQPIDQTLKAYARSIVDQDVLPNDSFVTCWRHEKLVLVGVPFEEGGTGYVYAMSTVTGAWSRLWHRGDDQRVEGSYYSPTSLKLFWSMSNAWEVRKFDDTAKGYDISYALTSPTCASPYTSVTVSGGNVGNWVPVVGDWVSRTLSGSTSYARITDVATGGSGYTFTLDRSLAGGDGGGAVFVGWEGLPCVMEWQQSGPPQGWELVRETQAHIDAYTPGSTALPGTIFLGLGGSSSFAAPTMVEGNPADPTQYSRPYRYGAPRASARGPHYYPRAEVNALGYPWRMHELAIIGEAGSERTRR